MVGYVAAEPDLRERYQFWLFGYESGDSIPFSAHLVRQSLRQARLLFDPKGTDEAFDRMVVVGHSLSGILAKMMGQESGLRLWQTVCGISDLGMATLRAQLPCAELTELERDRRLNRIDDLCTVGLLSSYITRKLDGRRGSDHMPTTHYSPVDLPTSVISTGI
jgi:hypothetical protein